MFTRKTPLKTLFAAPAGRDILNTLLVQTGLPAAALANPVVGALSLGALHKLTGGRVDDALIDGILALLNADAGETLPPEPPEPVHRWWKEAVVYQIYPRSFADSNGDGIGDLRGILGKLPYLQQLGVNVLWLSPVYDSPCDDNGYDIRDYEKILAEFGTMEDMRALLDAVHAAGMKLIMDLVVNHTSDEHAWFLASQADPAGPMRDYYIWRDGKGPGVPPNNWKSFFSGSAWRYDERSGQWVLHLFSEKQMDLNWDNPRVRADVCAMVRRWLDAGVDGFRMDVINLISKGSFADGSTLLAGAVGICGIEHYFYGPRLHAYLRELRAEGYGGHRDALAVGETPGIGMEMAKMLTAEGRGELDMVFQFDHLDCPGKNRFEPYRYDLGYLRRYLLRWQTQFGNGCWMSLFYNNHDNPRFVAKIDPDPARHPALARLLATIQFTLRGTPFVYQGDELGLGNAEFAGIDELRDVESLNRYRELCAHMPPEQAFAHTVHGTRDHARVPMPWDTSANGGFTTGTPWLRPHARRATDAAAQLRDEDSVYHYYRRLIALRRASEALVYGAFCPVFTRRRRAKDLLCYFRVGKTEKWYVECNLSPRSVPRPVPVGAPLVHVLGTNGVPREMLRPYEANIYRVGQARWDAKGETP